MNTSGSKIENIVNSIFIGVQSWLGYSKPISVSISSNIIITGIIVIITVLASAFWSAQLAEKDKRKRIFHFLGGFLIPWLYPILIYSSFAPTQKNISNSNPAEPEKKQTKDKIKVKLFTRSSINEDEDLLGPFIFILANNRTLEVKQIIEVKDTLIIVETLALSGENQKIRIPYPQIISYSKL